MYAAIRAYLKIETSLLTTFPNILAFSLCNLELHEIIHETVTTTKVLQKNIVIVIFKKQCILRNFT